MATATSISLADQFSVLPLDCLVESTANPRRTFDQAKPADLAESIRTQGLIMPLVVRPKGDLYQIVAGARRYRRVLHPQLAHFLITMTNRVAPAAAPTLALTTI
jgi:ParB/RepB/Spo0J family partition protein